MKYWENYCFYSRVKLRSRKVKSTSRNSSPKKWVLWLSLKVIQAVLIFLELYVYLFILCRHYSYYELLLITVGLIVSSTFFKQPMGFFLHSGFSLYRQLIWLANTRKKSRKERKGKAKEKEQGEKQKLYMINIKNTFIVTSKMNLNLLHKIKCYSVK